MSTYADRVDPLTATPLAEVPVYLRAATRGFDTAVRIDVGLVRFGGWQIHAVPAGGYAEDAYLVRAQVDLMLAPDVGGPRWAEVGFEFDAGQASVLDAVPQSVRSGEPQRTYRLSPLLNFVATAPDADDDRLIPLGPQHPVTEAFGIGGPQFRWRWTAPDDAGVPPGTRGGWFVLLVRPGERRIRVRPTAAYRFTDPDRSGLRPGCEPADREITLPEPTAPAAPTLSGAVRLALPGAVRLEVIRRLNGSWPDLADVVGVPMHDRPRFPPGEEPRSVLQWMEGRNRLHELADALERIGREDLAELVRGG